MTAGGVELKTGDALLYRGEGLVSRLIRLKTGAAVDHVEIYIGNGMTVAARKRNGARIYRAIDDGPPRVLRPTVPVDIHSAMQWFGRCADGQDYDAFEVFTNMPSSGKWSCGELAVRWYQAGGLGLMSNATAPGAFLRSPLFQEIRPCSHETTN